MAEPEVLKPAVREAIDAGIPVVSFNSGAEAASEVGTVMHISLDDREGGRIAADEFNARGIEGNVLCVIHQPNNIGLHDRCDGFEERFTGTVERWSPTSVETDVDDLKARLAEGNVDAVLALSSDSGVAVRIVIYLSRSDIPAATFGWSRLIGELVAEERMMFTILDHPELQPYLAAVASVIAERLRIDPGAYFNGAQLSIRPTIAGRRGHASPARLPDSAGVTAKAASRAAVPAQRPGPGLRHHTKAGAVALRVAPPLPG